MGREKGKVENGSMKEFQSVSVVKQIEEGLVDLQRFGTKKIIDVRNVATYDVPVVPERQFTNAEIVERYEIQSTFHSTPPLITIVANERGVTRIVVLSKLEEVLRLIRLGIASFPVCLITLEHIAQTAQISLSEVQREIDLLISQRLKTPHVAMVWRVHSLDYCLFEAAETR
jgi:hypothetical protein